MNEAELKKNMDEQISRLCDALWIIDGLATVKEITNWKEDGICDEEQGNLERMIQPCLNAAKEHIAVALERLGDLHDVLKEDWIANHSKNHRKES